MSAPQVIMTILISLCLAIDLVKHGEPKEGNYNFGSAVVGCVIMVWLLIWGGFY